MAFQRTWDSSCPVVYDRWEWEGGLWMIQDLRPEDDDNALQLLTDIMLNEETLCLILGIINEDESIRGMRDYWRACISQRMSLGCYRNINGIMELVAVNCCIVHSKGELDAYSVTGGKWNTLYQALDYVERKADAFEYVGADKVLFAMGLVVKKDCRGLKLGSRILAAREPLALSQGLKGTSTVFTGIASQISAERAGFEEIGCSSVAEFSEQGLDFPKDKTKIIKLMVKKYAS